MKFREHPTTIWAVTLICAISLIVGTVNFGHAQSVAPITPAQLNAVSSQAFAQGVQSQAAYVQQLEQRVRDLEAEIKSLKEGK